MTRDRLRDLYSARHEGTLEPGLVGVFDAAVAEDAEVAEDYALFVAACDGAEDVGREAVEIPEWLSARILDRLDAEPALSPLGKGFDLRGLLPRFGPAALGAVALVGATVTILRGTDGPVAPAGVVSSVPGSGDVPASAADTLRPVVENGKVFVDLQAGGPHDVGIHAGPDGALLRRFRVTDARLHSELANAQPHPYAFEVRVDRGERPLLVVVPGTVRDRTLEKGTGDLVGFARAIARTYGAPVALRVTTPKTAVVWDFTNVKSATEAGRGLDTLGLSVDAMPGGLLSVQDR